jgi:methylated-DNA-[protein]-cysteine S-methyltransferase
MTTHGYMPSPLGTLHLVTDGKALTHIYMEDRRYAKAPGAGWLRDDDQPVLAEARRQLTAYFEGQLTAFDLPLAPTGTPFQQRVWAELRRIPYGVTTTYGTLAERLGSPNASRAVGLANGRNPLGIIIPCHRVVGANGKLVGYGGGLWRKEALLALEAAKTPQVATR